MKRARMREIHQTAAWSTGQLALAINSSQMSRDLMEEIEINLRKSANMIASDLEEMDRKK